MKLKLDSSILCTRLRLAYSVCKARESVINRGTGTAAAGRDARIGTACRVARKNRRRPDIGSTIGLNYHRGAFCVGRPTAGMPDK